MPVGHMVLKIYVSCKNFHVPSQYLYKPCKAYVYCWENKYMPRLKNHLPSRACNHKILCALGQDLLAPGMRARLNVEPCHFVLPLLLEKVREKVMEKSLNFILGFLYEPCLRKNFNEMLIKIQTLSLKKICFKMSSAKCPFRLCLDVLTMNVY